MTIRAVIYARYSSNLQRDASIEDQVRLCKERIDHERWALTATYKDRGISGANPLRPGYQSLLEDARKGAFDVVVAEALDRLSRDQEHVAALYKQLSFNGVKLVTVAEGEISELHVGLKGTMNALYLKDLALKTRRGLEGRVRQGRSGGGISYGYRVLKEVDANGDPVYGGRRIDEAESAIVQRIFQDYANGTSPRAIAKTLNAEGVPGPRGRTWTASTIHGNRNRGTGILNNELYIGRLVWNRQRFLKDPATGKRVARPNLERLWLIQDVPQLRILDQELWDAVKKRQAALEISDRSVKVRNALNDRHRSRYLLSGLLVCGVCGAGYTLVGSNRYACADHVNRGTCSNRRTIARAVIERRVLAGLKDRLMAPELVAEFIREFQREFNRRAHEAERSRATFQAELTDAERRIKQVLDAIEQGIFTVSTKDRLLELEAKRDEVRARLEAAAEPAPVPRLHPNLAEIYRRKVEDLETALNDPRDRAEAHAVLRGLVDRIVLYPGDKRGEVAAEMSGEIAALLQLADSKQKTRTSDEVRVSLVAGACNWLYLLLVAIALPNRHTASRRP